MTTAEKGFDWAVGWAVGRQVVRVERAPLARFALAIADDSAVHQDSRVALERGFSSVPAPLTYPFAMGYWGAHRELQVESDPTSDLSPELRQLGHVGVVMAALMRSLGPGIVLHAEQEFDYRRPLVAGDVLNADTSVDRVDTKQGNGGTLTFVAITTRWTDVRSGALALTSTFTAVHQDQRDTVSTATDRRSAP